MLHCGHHVLALGVVPTGRMSVGMSVVQDADMWGLLAEAATLLDAADSDWRALQTIEEMLRSLSSELERVSARETAHPRNRLRVRPADPASPPIIQATWTRKACESAVR